METLLYVRLKYFMVDWAALNNHKNFVEALIKAGAEVDIKNMFDKTPFEEAVELGKSEIAVILLGLFRGIFGSIS